MVYGEVASNLLWEVAANATESVSKAIPGHVHEHLQLTQQAFSTTWQSLKLWGLVFYPLFNGLFKVVMTIANAALPVLPWLWEHIKAGAAYLWGVFVAHGWPRIKAMLAEVVRKLSEADPMMVAMVVAFIATVIAVVLVARWIYSQGYVARARASVYRRWTSFTSSAKKVLTGLHSSVFHVGLVLHAVLCMIYFPQVLEATAQPAIFWTVAVLIPAYYSFHVLHDLRVEGVCKDPQILRKWLIYWVVLMTGGLVLSMPFVLALTARVWTLNALRVHFAFWLWFPYTDGCEFIYGIITPMRESFVRALPSGPQLVSQEDQGIFRRLMSLIATEQIRELMHWMVDTGPAIILSFLFFLTPGFITAYGVVFVGIAYPIFCSIRALEVTSTTTPNAKVKVIPDTPRTPAPGRQKSIIPVRPDIKWLVYWSAYAPVKMCIESLEVYFSQLPLWHHLELVIVFWLLIRGANFIVKEADHLMYRQFWAQRDREERMREYEAEVRGSGMGGDRDGAAAIAEGDIDTPSLLGSAMPGKRLDLSRRGMLPQPDSPKPSTPLTAKPREGEATRRKSQLRPKDE